MKRVLVLVEGQTEETFVQQVLAPYLLAKMVIIIPTLLSTKPRRANQTGIKGGIVSFSKIEVQVKRLMDDRDAALITTMFDFYGLRGEGFPGYDTMPAGNCYEKVAHLETALKRHFDRPRFLPYLMLHEFEAMLFASPAAFGKQFPSADKRKLEALTQIERQFSSPEAINDELPPTKRIKALLPEYDKVFHGTLIALDIGLARIRETCSHFNGWLSQIESHGQTR